MWIAVDRLTNWECVKEFSVGGLEWIGFSKEYYNKLLCISSQKCTLVDCKTGIIDECDCEYDELTHTALCSLLPNEVINISGQYGEKFHILLRKMIMLELKSSQIIRRQSILQMIHNLKLLYLKIMDFILVDLVIMANILCLHKMPELLC